MYLCNLNSYLRVSIPSTTMKSSMSCAFAMLQNIAKNITDMVCINFINFLF